MADDTAGCSHSYLLVFYEGFYFTLDVLVLLLEELFDFGAGQLGLLLLE